MKPFHSAIRMAAALTAAFSFAHAQQVAEVGRISYDDIPSPIFDIGGAAKNFNPKNWLEMEVGIEVPAQNRQQAEIGFIDRLLVKWYVAINDKATGKPVLLTKDVNHINVPVDEEIYSSVYISPNTLKRLTGSERAGKGSVEVVGIEVFVDGVKVGQATTKHQEGWWNAATLSRGDRYPLLDKNETPFKMLWWDRYAEVEERR